MKELPDTMLGMIRTEVRSKSATVTLDMSSPMARRIRAAYAIASTLHRYGSFIAMT